MDSTEILKKLKICNMALENIVSLFHENIKVHNYYPQFKEYDCESDYPRFRKVQIAFSNNKDFYIVFFFDLNDEKSVLSLVHKEFYESDLIEISEFEVQSTNQNGIIKNNEYFIHNYNPDFLPKNKIIFRRQYPIKEIEQEGFSKYFKNDFSEICNLFNQIEKTQLNKIHGAML